MDYYEATELAAEMLGIDTRSDDYEESEVEELFWDRFEVSIESFQKIASKLLKLTPIVETSITQSKVQGFLKGNMFIVKEYVKESL